MITAPIFNFTKDLHERFCSHVAQKNYSQNYVAKELGYASATVSLYKNKTYAGDIEKLEIRISRWLDDEKRREEMLIIPRLRITSVKNIQIAIDAAKNRRNISVITGDAGTGKSVGAQVYVENSSQALYVEVGPLRNRKSLLRDIAKKLDLEPKGSSDLIIEMLVDRLRDSGKVIIIDEADRLDFEKLDMLRRISDMTKCGLVLIAVTKFEGELIHKNADYGQLSSRVGVCLRLNEIKEEYLTNDMKDILDATGIDYETDALKTLRIKCRNSLRKFCDTLISCHDLMQKYQTKKLTGDIVDDAISMRLK
ncbi:MAG: AAA family ATPase [Spirochaetes bacterium]|nr:AAA family ATPase [Spirochaetota bacterium]